MKSSLCLFLALLGASGNLHAAEPVKKVLFFSKSSGFEHSVIRNVDGKPSLVEEVLAELGRKEGFEFTCTKDGRVFTKEGLAPYDAVFFYTTGDLTKAGNDGQPPMPEDGRQVLIDFISSGNGFIGTHSATDTFHSEGDRFSCQEKCDPYIHMLGGEFITHGSQQVATLRVADKAFPGMAGAGEKFTLMEEWYAMKNFAPDLRVLLVQETATMTGNAKGNPYARPEYPAAWARMQGKGRVYYTSLGHKPGTWKNPVFQQMLTGGLDWVTGKVDADVTANLKQVTPGFATNGPPSLKVAAEPTEEEMPEKPAPAATPGGNLAKGKPATASGSQGGARPNPPANALDGDAASYWAAKDLSFPQWLRVDLGKPEKLLSSRIAWTSGKHHFRYRIEGSLDDKAWKVLAEDADGKNLKTAEDKLAGAEVRYVRVTLTGISEQDPKVVRPGISEWELLGEATAAVAVRAAAPDPATPEKEKALLAETKVPEGFRATIFAAPPMVNYPTFIATSPDGTVYVSCDKNGAGGRKPGQGRIVRLRDTDGDGRADEVKDFVPDIDTPRGLVWDRDRLYVMHPPHLSVHIDKDGDGVAEESKVLVKNIGWGFKDRSGDHASDGLEMGIDGWLYGSIGDFGFFNAEGTDGRKVTMRGGGVIRVRPDGTGLEIHSRGTRNVYAVAVDPLLNVFGRDNNNDGSWGVLLHHFTGLSHHGYPSLFMNFPEDRVSPLADYVTGSGSGAFYLDEPSIPEKWRGLLTCDWGKSFVYHHPLKPSGATFKAEQEEFIGVPRTIDVKADMAGNLYVASWRGAIFNYAGEDVGYIARVSADGTKPVTLDFRRTDSAALVERLASPGSRTRLEAQRELLSRGLDDVSAVKVLEIVKDRRHPLEARVAALFALKQSLGAKSHGMITALIEDDALRPFIIRALADRPDQAEGIPVARIIASLKDPLPRVRLESANALSRQGDAKSSSALAAVLDEKDPVVLHAMVRALGTLESDAACLALLGDAATSPAAHEAALQVLRVRHRPEVVEGIIGRLGKEKDGVKRRSLLTALCRLHSREGEWKGAGWGLTPDISGPYFQTEKWEKSDEIAEVLRREVVAAKGDEAAFLIGELNRHQIHMEEAVSSILTLAGQDVRHLPAAVDMVARGTAVPETAVPLLVRAALDAKASDDVRGDAVVALSRTASTEGCLASLRVFADFDKKPRGERLRSRPFKRAKEAFFGSKLLVSHVPALEKLSAGGDDELSPWADAALLKAGDSSPEAKAAIEKAWSAPAGRIQVLKGISLATHRTSKDRVLAALADPDKAVAAAARAAAKDLKLDPNAKPAAMVGTLDPAAVIRTMAKMKGDKDLGEQLFQQQSCATCHTVDAGQPLKAGPYLGGTAGVYRRDELAEMILNPSKSLAQGYEPHQVTTKDGTAYVGFIESIDKEKMVIRDMGMKRTEVAVSTISSNQEMEMSLMPPGLAANLTEKELAALLSYLESLSQH